ncbi:MAG: chloride channel protein [Oligoflexia bacterium]|nr:chloride channel protein [Oligoflexia bacterium]
MLGPIVTGILSAVVAQAVLWLQMRMQDGNSLAGVPAYAGALIGTAIALFFCFAFRRRRDLSSDYHGISDMLIHIHQSASPDVPSRWLGRSAISAFFSIFSGNVGSEGPAMELVYGAFLRFRPRSARWFEQRRRTEASSTLAAGIAASFGAPFAAILAPIELGTGGRAISSAVCALSAYLSSRFLIAFFSLHKFEVAGSFYEVSLAGAKEWIALVLTAVVCGFCGIVLAGFIDYFGKSLRKAVGHSSGQTGWARIALGGGLLVAVFAIYPPAARLPYGVLEDLFWGRVSLGDSGILFFSKALSFAIILGAFGTAGAFWPIFALGGLFGFVFSQGVLHGFFPDLAAFAPLAALAGASAFWGSMLGAPVTGAVLACELTDSMKFLFPCLVAGLIARELAQRLGARTLFERDLGARGLRLSEGRLESILATLKVSDAMVVDFECSREEEPVAEARQKLLRATHPFLPVVRADGTYSGLLTIDMVHESVAEGAHGQSSLAKLLEVKDLLYRSGFRTPQVEQDDPLTVTIGLFHDIPCVPVVGKDGKVQGLLYGQNVRLIYDREVSRRSLHSSAI